MVTIVVAIHVLVCLALIIVILLQQGKGAEIGAVFGGSSQTVFGASGAGNVMTKATWAMAAVFFATSIFLAYASTRRFTGSIFGSGGGTSRRVVVPAKPVIPSAPGGSVPARSAAGGSAAGGSSPMTAPAAPAAPAQQGKPLAPKPGP
jgi:preprotein translocase subunit SecG